MDPIRYVVDMNGYTPRKKRENTTRQAMPQGRRKRGRPKQSWMCTETKEQENIGRTWGEAKLMADE